MLAVNRLTKTCFVLFVFILSVVSASAQKNVLKGSVVDTAEKKNLHYAIVALINKADSTLYRSIRSNEEGVFGFTGVPAGRYTVMVSYPKMADFLQDITVSDTSKIDLGKVPMTTEAKLLEEVVVRAGVPIRMRGDTLEYTADSFALKPNQTVEELLKRLPGIQVEKDGKIMAQGQEVKTVLVDGDEFFSDDPGLALKYLQAGAVDKVQVFDKKSAQSEFTGIDDGSRNKTINLKLKKNSKHGYFGKLSAGADGKNYYQHEAMGALFNGNKKISVFGTAAKTGAAGLSYQDMSKYVTQDYEAIGDGMGGVAYYTSNSDYESDRYWGNGLPSVLYGGAHFSDKWGGDKQKVFANYRIKEIKADGWSNSNGSNILPDGTGFFNKSDSRESSYSFSQKASGNFTTKLDSFTTLKLSANGSLGRNNNNNWSTSESKNEKGFLVNNNEQSYKNESENKRFGSDITLQKKFRKDGRTFSFSFQQEHSSNITDAYTFNATNYFDPANGDFRRADTLNQLQQTRSPFESYAVRGTYTDKFTKELGISLEYGWKTAQSSNVFNTFNDVNGKYTARVDSLSNDYDFTVNTHISAAMLSWSTKKMNITAGSRVFHTGMEQVNNDLNKGVTRRFINFAPNLSIGLRVIKNTNIDIGYNGETSQPSVDQLQPLRRTNNPLYVQVGNPDLRPSFRHTGRVSFNRFKMNGNYMYGSLYYTYTDNAITMQRSTDAQNRTVSQFVNLDGVGMLSANVGFNWNLKKWKLRPSLYFYGSKGGGNSVQNGITIKNENISSSIRGGLSHDWPNVMSTSYSNSFTYSVGWSDAPNNQTNRNFSHTHTLNNRFFLPWDIEVVSDCNFQFQPKNKAFNNNINIIQWNASVEKKLLKNEQGVIKFSVNDILNQNTGYNRYISGNSINESNRLVLKRYFLLTLTWNFMKTF
jgi:hypothetical protein